MPTSKIHHDTIHTSPHTRPKLPARSKTTGSSTGYDENNAAHDSIADDTIAPTISDQASTRSRKSGISSASSRISTHSIQDVTSFCASTIAVTKIGFRHPELLFPPSVQVLVDDLQDMGRGKRFVSPDLARIPAIRDALVGRAEICLPSHYRRRGPVCRLEPLGEHQ